MKRFFVSFLIVGAFVVITGCDNNPFYPDAEVRLVKVDPENSKLDIIYQLVYVKNQEGVVVRVDTVVTYSVSPVLFTFQELYGGRWADINHYHIEYTSVTTNYGDTLDYGPLDGGFNLYIAPSEQATAQLWTVPYDIIHDCATSYLPFIQGLSDSLIITFQEQIEFTGEDELGNDIEWHVPHSTVVYYTFQVIEEQESGGGK